MSETDLLSPDGRILVELAWAEWRATLWTQSPRVTDTASGAILLDLWGDDWDAAVSWIGQSAVRLDLRRYNHPGDLIVIIDPHDGIYRLGGEDGQAFQLGDLQSAVEQAFKAFPPVRPPPPPPEFTSINSMVQGLMAGPVLAIMGIGLIGYAIALALNLVEDQTSHDGWFYVHLGMAGNLAMIALFGAACFFGGIWMFRSGLNQRRAMKTIYPAHRKS